MVPTSACAAARSHRIQNWGVQAHEPALMLRACSTRAWPPLRIARLLCRSASSGDGAFEDAASCRPVELGDVTLQFSRSSGPGGQNVNKLNTKAELRLDLDRSRAWIPPKVLAQLRRIHRNRISTRDVLVVSASQFRTQHANVKDGLARVQALLDDACAAAAPPKEPSPEKRRRIRALQTAENRKRIEEKKRLSQKKSARRGDS